MSTEKQSCGSCRYWSEMIARAGAGTTNPAGDVEALCLSATSSESGKYKVAGDRCDAWASNELHGAVDAPEHAGGDPYEEDDTADRDGAESTATRAALDREFGDDDDRAF